MRLPDTADWLRAPECALHSGDCVGGLECCLVWIFTRVVA
jgi:hypothetical protein